MCFSMQRFSQCIFLFFLLFFFSLCKAIQFIICEQHLFIYFRMFFSSVVCKFLYIRISQFAAKALTIKMTTTTTMLARRKVFVFHLYFVAECACCMRDAELCVGVCLPVCVFVCTWVGVPAFALPQWRYSLYVVTPVKERNLSKRINICVLRSKCLASIFIWFGESERAIVFVL